MNDEDIRWYDQIKKRKCTYIETLDAEAKRKNRWITKRRWAEIEKTLPTTTEEEAKKLCFDIRDTIRSEIKYYKTLYG